MTTIRGSLFVLVLGLLLAPVGRGQAPSPESGEQLHGKIIERIEISPLKYTREEIITRELASRVGAPFRNENLPKDRERLDRLGIFSAIFLRPVEENGRVVLQVEVKETTPTIPLLSVDVSEENGFSAGPGLKSINLLGRDISLSAAVQFGGATTGKVTLENPWFAGNHLSYLLDFDQRDRRNELDDFDEISTEFEARLGSYLGENGRIGGRFHFLSLKSDILDITLSDGDRDHLPTLGFFVGYDSRDVWTDPRRGWWAELDVARTMGDGRFWSFIADTRSYQPLNDRHALAFYSLATLRTGQVGDEIPIHQDFHLGGSNSMRGWSLDSGRGKNQWINTAEYRFTVMPRKMGTIKGFTAYLGLQLALFTDFGIAWGGQQSFSTQNFLDGYGVGIRFLVPYVDVIRLDFAFGGGSHSHFGIGDKAVEQRKRIR